MADSTADKGAPDQEGLTEPTESSSDLSTEERSAKDAGEQAFAEEAEPGLSSEEESVRQSNEARESGPRFGLSFIDGKALIGFSSRAINEWLTVGDLCLEVPNIRFPFDVTAGAETFRNRRCRLVGLAFEACEEGAIKFLLAHLRPLLSGDASPLRDLEFRFAEGFAELAGTISAGLLDETGGDAGHTGEEVPFTLKIAIDASATSEVRLLVHDARIYAPSSLPAPAVAVAFLGAVERSGLPVSVEPPSTIRFEPVSPYLRGLLPKNGWKLPDLRHCRLSSAKIEPGLARLVFDAGKEGHPKPDAEKMRGFLSALEGSSAFKEAEAALAAGRYRDARDAWLEATGPLPEHPFAAERLLALFLADPTTVDDAVDLAAACLERDPGFVPAILTRALARARRDEAEGAADLLEVAEMATRGGELLGAIKAAVTAGRLAEAQAAFADTDNRRDDASDLRALAARAFERVLALQPRDREATLALSRLLPRLGDLWATERILNKRLSLAAMDEERADIHLALGRIYSGEHAAMGAPARQHESREARPAFEKNPTRARLHLDAALRHDPHLADAWVSLGRACARAEDPLRAVRCLDKGMELLLSEGRANEAAAAAREVATIWERDLAHPENAILRYRQVLEIIPGDIEARLRHAEISLSLGHVTEAESGFETLLERLGHEATGRAAPGDTDSTRAALTARLALAEVSKRHYHEPEVALGHLESALKLASQLGEDHRAAPILAEIVDCCEALGDTSRLVHACDRAAAAQTDPVVEASYLSRAARLHLALDDTDAARERAAKARALDPDGMEARVARVAVEAACGSPEDHAAALDDLARHIDDPASRAPHLVGLGRLRLEKLEMAGAALAPLASARDEASDEALRREAAELHLSACRRMGEPPKTAASLEALALCPGQEEWRRTAALLEAALLREEELGDPEGAIDLLVKLRRLDPEDPRPAWHLGRLYLAAEDPKAAWSVFLEMNALGGPEAAGVPVRVALPILGEAALAAGDRESAARYSSLALELDPSDEALESRALCLLEELGRHKERASLLRICAGAHARQGEPAKAATRHRAAAAIFEEHLVDPSSAAADLDAALAISFPPEEIEDALRIPLEWESRHQEALAAALDRLRLSTAAGDTGARAQARYRLAALSLDPIAGAEHLFQRAIDLLEIGDRDSAASSLKITVDLDESRVDAHERLVALLREESPEEALFHLERLIELCKGDGAGPTHESPEKVLEWRLLAAEIARGAGLVDRALHHLGIYVAHKPGDPGACTQLADLLRSIQSWNDLYAIQVHLGENLLSRPADEPETFMLAAETLLEAGSVATEKLDRPDLARAALEMILEKDPGHVPALEALLPLLRPPDWNELRAELLGRLAEKETSEKRRAELLADQGDCLLDLSTSEAELAYQMALTDDPSSIRAADGLASVAWKRSDIFAFAHACWTRARMAAEVAGDDAAVRLMVTARLHLDLLGDTRAGLTALDLALGEKIRPSLSKEDLSEALRRRLACHLAVGDARGALADLTEMIDRGRAVSCPEDRAALHRRRAGLREATEDQTGAREDWAEAHRLDRDDPISLERLMAFAEKEGDLRALAHLHSYQAAQALRRGHLDSAARALAERARLLSGPLENPAAAITELERACELGVDGALKSTLLQSLRESLLALGRTEEAVTTALREAALLPDAEASSHLLETAAIAAEAEREDLALACSRLAHRRSPEDLPVAIFTMRRLFHAGAMEECLPIAALIASCDPVEISRALDLGETEAEEVQRTAAVILLEHEREEAFPLLETLVETRATDALISDAFVDLCLARGDLERAERALLARIDAGPTRLRPALARRLADIAAASGQASKEARWLEEAMGLGEEGVCEAELERLLAATLAGGDTTGYVEKARRHLETLIQEEPERAGSELQLRANLLLDRGSPADALTLLSAFDEIRGESTILLQTWLLAADAAGTIDQVIEARDQLVQLLVEEGDEEGAASHLLALGELHESRGDLESACNSFQEALLRGTKDPAVLERALSIARQRGDHLCEADLLEMAVEAAEDPEESATRLSSLARIFLGPLSSPARAEAALREAIARAPGYRQARDELGGLLLDSERFTELAELLRQTAEGAQGPDRASLLVDAARHHRSGKSPAEAVADLLAASEGDQETFQREDGPALLDEARAEAGMHLDRAEARLAEPDDPAGASKYLEAGDILRDQVQDLRAAAEAYRRSFRQGGDQRAAQRLRETFSALDDHLGLAELAKEEAATAPPGPAKLALLRSCGDLYESAGEIDAAIDAWKLALMEAPGEASVFERLGRILESEQRHAELAELTRSMAEGRAGKELANTLVEAARLHCSANEADRAIQCLEEAEAADPEHEDAARLLAELLWEAERKDESVIRYLRVLPREALGSRVHERVTEHLEAEDRLRELAEVTTARASAARMAGEEKPALDLYLRAVRLWVRAGEPSATRAAAFGAFHLDPGDEEAFEATMRCVAEDGDTSWLVEILEAHVDALPSESPRRVGQLQRLIEARQEAGDPGGARADLDALISIAGHDAKIVAWAFSLAKESGWPDSSERITTLAARIVDLAAIGDLADRPVLLEAYRKLATVAVKEQRPKVALGHLRGALALIESRAEERDLTELLAKCAVDADLHGEAATAFLRIADLGDDLGTRVEALRRAAGCFEQDDDRGAASEAWRRLFEIDPSNETAFTALLDATPEPEARIGVLQNHVEAIDSLEKKRNLQLETAGLADRCGDSTLAARSRLEAWSLFPGDLLCAKEALGPLRSGKRSADLAAALCVVAEDSAPAAALLLRAEAVEALEASEDLDAAAALASKALEDASDAAERDEIDDEGRARMTEVLGALFESAALGTEESSEIARLAGACAALALDASRIEFLLSGADYSRDAGDRDSERRALEEALEISPEDERAFERLITALLDTDDLEAAAAVARAYSASPPLHPLVRAADAAETAGRFDLAAELLVAITRIDKRSPTWCARLTEARAQAGDSAGAAASAALHVERLEQEQAGSGEILDALAHAARLNDEADQPLIASRFRQTIIDRDPGHLEAASALDAWHRGRKSWSELIGLHESRGERLAAAGRSEEAAEAAISECDAAREAQDLGRAMAALESALLRRPGHEGARTRLNELAGLAEKGGDDELTSRALEAAMDSADRPQVRAEAALALARHHRGAKRTSEACEAYAHAIGWANGEGRDSSTDLVGEILREAGSYLAGCALAENDSVSAHDFVKLARLAGASGRDLRHLEARAAEGVGEIDAARDAWRALVEENPEDSAALESLVKLAIALEDAETELWALRRMAERGGSKEGASDLWITLGDRAEALGRHDDSKEAYFRALDIEPGRRCAFDALRRRLESDDDIDALLSLWRRWAREVEDDESKADAFFEEGRLARERTPDLERAAEAFERCLAIAPEREEALAALAHTLHELGAHKRAESLLRSAPQGNSELPSFLVQYRLGQYALADGRLEEALADFKQSYAKNPSFIDAWEDGLATARKLGDQGSIAEILEGLLDGPSTMDSETRLARLRELYTVKRTLGDLDGAAESLADALDLRPDDRELVLLLRSVSEERERFADVADLLSRLVGLTEEGSERAALLVEQADLYSARLDDVEASDRSLRAAVSTDPDNVEAWRRILSRSVTLDESQAIAKAARKLAELGHEEALGRWPLEIGRALTAHGDFELAAPLLETASFSRPGDRDVASEAAAALIRSGFSRMAVAVLDRLASVTGAPMDYRAAAEAALCDGDERGFIDRMARGIDDPELVFEERSMATRSVAARLSRLGDLSAAIDLLHKVAAERPSARDLRHDLAQSLLDAGRYGEAHDLYLDLARSDPSDERAVSCLAGLLEAAEPERADLAHALVRFLHGEDASPEPEAACPDPLALHIDDGARAAICDPLAQGPVARFLRAMAPTLHSLFPAELERWNVGVGDLRLPESDPVAARAMAWAAVVGAPYFNLYESERLGFEIVIENSRPPSIILGSSVIEGPQRELDQILCRAVDLLAAGYALPSKFAAKDFATLIRMAISFFHEGVEISLSDEDLATYHGLLRDLIPEENKETLALLAGDALTAMPRFDPAAFAPALRRTSDRVALLCTGDLPATLGAAIKLDPRAAGGETRSEIVRSDPSLFDLCRFALREDVGDLYHRVRSR